MKHFLNTLAFSLIAISSLAADITLTNDSAAAQKERLFQRFVQEAQKMDPSDTNWSSTNAETLADLRRVFESMIVDPSFGLRWDEVPGPTMTGSNAIAAVISFVATNGWNMQTNDSIFDSIPGHGDARSAPIRGLPWVVIHEREFPAVTHDNILYVFFKGFHHDGSGVAYNPNTNQFAATIYWFKPIGQHWYAWAFDHEFGRPDPQQRIYEGAGPVTNVTPASK